MLRRVITGVTNPFSAVAEMSHTRAISHFRSEARLVADSMQLRTRKWRFGHADMKQ